MRLLLVGKAKYLWQMLEVLATYQKLEQDKKWWAVRTWVLATDRDQQASELSLEAGLKLRRN